MIGPPALKFRMKKFELFVGSGGGAALGSGATVAVTAAEAAGAGEVAAAAPGEIAVAGEVPISGEVPTAGAVPGAAGDISGAVAPGAAAAGAFGAVVVSVAGDTPGDAAASAGDVPAGAVAGDTAGFWPKAARVSVAEHRLTISVFFILGRLMVEPRFPAICVRLFITNQVKARPAKSFEILSPRNLHKVHSSNRIQFYCGM